MPDQAGRLYVVTGANSGLGLETARVLVGAGAHVVLAVRDEQRGQRAAGGLTGRGSTEVRRLDLADLGSVRAFAEAWDGGIDVLVNNAGVMAIPRGSTIDRFEQQIGTNHLGHFALTNLLLPYVTDRVVTLSSTAHWIGRIDLADLSWDRRRYRRWGAYGQSKLANLLFALELQRRLDASGSPLRSVAAHPGYAATELQSHTGEQVSRALMSVGNRLFAQTAAEGAISTLFAATADVPGGAFFGPGGTLGRGAVAPASRSPRARDADLARRLWDVSEHLTETTYPL